MSAAAALRLCPLVVSCSIKQLTKLISDLAPAAIKEETLAELNGRKIAIDASMAIYQFLVRGESHDTGRDRRCGTTGPSELEHLEQLPDARGCGPRSAVLPPA
jgi:hypothetical protein